MSTTTEADLASADITEASLNAALRKVRQLLQADGGDIAIAQISGGQVRLDLILDNSDCPECVLPADALEPIAFEMMSAELPQLSSVQISDPRDSDTGDPRSAQ